MGLPWIKIASNLDSHPKIRRAGRLGREVFMFALRKNGDSFVPGIVPGPMLDPWYIADQLMMTETEAQHGIQQCQLAGLLVQLDSSWSIVGWDDQEWGVPEHTEKYTTSRREGGLARAKSATRGPGGAFQPASTSSAGPAETPASTSNQHSQVDKIRLEEIRVENTEAGPPGLVVAAGTSRTRKPKAVYSEPELASAFVVLEKLGAVSKTEYSGARAHLKLIVGRLREGLTEMDLRRIVAYCADEWEAKPEMQKYLRPETLFGPETHAKYLDAARARYPQEST